MTAKKSKEQTPTVQPNDDLLSAPAPATTPSQPQKTQSTASKMGSLFNNVKSMTAKKPKEQTPTVQPTDDLLSTPMEQPDKSMNLKATTNKFMSGGKNLFNKVKSMTTTPKQKETKPTTISPLPTQSTTPIVSQPISVPSYPTSAPSTTTDDFFSIPEAPTNLMNSYDNSMSFFGTPAPAPAPTSQPTNLMDDNMMSFTNEPSSPFIDLADDPFIDMSSSTNVPTTTVKKQEDYLDMFDTPAQTNSFTPSQPASVNPFDAFDMQPASTNDFFSFSTPSSAPMNTDDNIFSSFTDASTTAPAKSNAKQTFNNFFSKTKSNFSSMMKKNKQQEDSLI